MEEQQQGIHPSWDLEWEKAIEQQEATPDRIRHRALICRASRWDFCAVGESLRDIAKVQQAGRRVIKESPTLNDGGNAFYTFVEIGDWPEAKKTLKDIREWVTEHKAHLKNMQQNILNGKDPHDGERLYP